MRFRPAPRSPGDVIKYAAHSSGERHRMANDTINRLLGGPPLTVLGRLVLMSIVVGAVLSAVGLDPWNILQSIENLIRHVWNMGFDALRWLWRYFLLGGALVVPIWLLVRLTRGAAGGR